ncbi:esterase/lipase family protein [Bacillus cereus group sp. MYBK30-1]|uniref:esterase/lipase family protein n=1 Tax=unclassified Bacillus cereus group TaxID=2750818 RepID=UPI003F798766
MGIMKRCIVLLIVLFIMSPMVISTNIQAEVVKELKTGFPDKEVYTPGEWFLGKKPANYDENKPPILFVQGRNGNADSWYGKTVYHDINDMYDYAVKAGYQTVFIQLYDAAGKGSASQWDNGKLLAQKLEEIYNHFGKKVNIVAHSKGGIDTQAALVGYGANRFVGNVITLATPHYGSNLADLSYSWWAGWLASILGQKDDGTYSLQIGEMAKFRSTIDNNPAVKLNRYFTATGTSWGPVFSALSMGGLYLASYGSNDGLVNEWSAKLPYGTHLFTDSRFDHDNIRKGSAVFARIEPYLRTANVAVPALLAPSYSSDEKVEQLNTTSNQNILGGELQQNQWIGQTVVVDKKAEGTVSVLTASSDVETQLISPKGKVYTNKDSALAIGEGESFFKGATIRTFKFDKMDVGEWQVKMMAKQPKDAYLIVTDYKKEAPFVLQMPAKVKLDKTDYKLKKSPTAPEMKGDLLVTVRVINKEGELVSESNESQNINTNTFTGALKNVKQPGVYNITIDIKGMNKEGQPYNRTIVKSVYVEK